MALGKAPSNLTPNQQAKVEWIAKTDPRLYRAYKLKESLRLVFYNDTVEDAKESLDAWFKWARHCRISAFVELQKKIKRHKQSILNTIEYGLTNARITRNQMAELFDRDVKTIGKHINNAVNIILVNYSVTELPEHLN